MDRRLLLALLAASALAGCKLGESEERSPVSQSCSPVGNACARHADCCSFGCEMGSCARNPDLGGTCRTSDDCYWTMTCVNGACAAGAVCRNDTDVCSFDNDCCSGNCAAGTCLPNHAPTVNLGADRSASFYTSVSLGGTVADQDGDTLVYGWTLLSAPAGHGLGAWTSGAANPSVLLDVPGAYNFRLVVTDGPPSQRNRLTAQDDVAILAVNDPPVVNAGADATLSRSASLSVQGTVSDPNLGAAPVSCEWRQTPPGGAETTVATFATCPATPAYTFVSPQAGPEGAWTFTLVASDGQNVSSDARTVTVVNDAPVLGALPARAGNLGPGETAGAPVPVTATATDPNQDTAFTWTWTFDQVAPGSALTNGDLVGASTPSVSFSPDVKGAGAGSRYVLRIQVCDAAPACTEGTVGVDVYRHVKDLGHAVADAEWASGSIFAVGAYPASAGTGRLWVYAGGALQQSVDLATAPRQVGVDATGKLVVAGDDVFVRWVDLNVTTPVPEVLTAPYPIGDIAVSNVRYAVLLPSAGTPYLQILDVSAKALDPTTRYGRYATASPAGAAATDVFVVDDHFAYGDLTQYAVQNPGVLSLVRANTSYACAGRIWAAANGGHVFDACGDVHTTAALAFTKSLGATGLRHVHSAAATGEAVALDAAGTTLLRFNATFDPNGTEVIPTWGFAGTGFQATGRFAFVSADGATRWVIVEANGHTGLVTFP